MVRRFGGMVVALAALLGGSGQAKAGLIATRAALDSLLGGTGTLDNFETLSVSNGNALSQLNIGTLSSTSTISGQGNLVAPGANFVFGSGYLQWDGKNYFGSPSEEILNQSGPMVVVFTTPVTAFGVDLRAFQNYGSTATMTVYAPDDTTVIGTLTGISLPSSGVAVFEGWQDSGGIGKVVLSQTAPFPGATYSPVIDNFEFGNAGATSATPEPATLTLLGIGGAGVAGYRWRKRKQQAQ